MALLAACSTAPGTASCAPCAGPGLLAAGLPAGIDQGVIRTCVGQEPCTRAEITHLVGPQSQEYLPIDSAGHWQDYDGTPVLVTISSEGRHWRGTGDLVFHDAGAGTCSCAGLVARVVMESFSPVDSRRR